MKLNRPWTRPWEVIKRLNDVVYRIRYQGRGRKRVKRRVVHYNQLKPFLGRNSGDQEQQNQVLKQPTQPNRKSASGDPIVTEDNNISNHEEELGEQPWAT